MNPIQLGLRNLLGVIIPGALLTLVLVYSTLVVSAPLGWSSDQVKDQGALISVGLFLISYALGSVIRLYAADSVDKWSVSMRAAVNWIRNSLYEWAHLRRYHPYRGPYKNGSVENQMRKLLKEIVTESVANVARPENWPKEQSEWVWTNDTFPYPVWQFAKFRLYHPGEMFRFFKRYERCFGTGERRGKEFFNYCKTVIYSASRQDDSGLAEEVQAAEANTRFFAGTFHAFACSSAILAGCGVIQFYQSGMSYNLVLTGVSLMATVVMSLLIIAGGRFRLLRLKEVDVVFDAFFLVHRHPDECGRCSEATMEQTPYLEREKLLREAFSTSSDGVPAYGPIALTHLLTLMRESSAKNEFLSCMYFAGAVGDHPYFVKSERFAAGISVLPQDEKKSSKLKRHRHQKEVLFVLEGRIRLELEEEVGQLRERTLDVGKVAVIEPGQCHRITPVGREEGAYLFVKTDPAEEPREEACEINSY